MPHDAVVQATSMEANVDVTATKRALLLAEKARTIPVERRPYGFVQRSRFVQPDHWHEAVIEYEGPLPPSSSGTSHSGMGTPADNENDSSLVSEYPSATKVFTFLLLGDQNAGKSTFIHAFCSQEDDAFFQIMAILPILTSSFINSRFLVGEHQTLSRARDELPFIDTDVARGSILVSLEDFLFFLEDFKIDAEHYVKSITADVRFVVLQFIEIGGDHLDRMIACDSETQPPHICSLLSNQNAIKAKGQVIYEAEDMVRRSKILLELAQKSLYFVNANTLFEVTASSFLASAVQCDQNSSFMSDVVIDPNALRNLFMRLDFLGVVLKSGHEVILQLSRTEEVVTHSRSYCPDVADCDIKKLLTKGDLHLTRLLKDVLNCYNHSEGHVPWPFVIPAILTSDHLQPDGTLNSQALVCTLGRLLEHQQTVSGASDPFDIVARYFWSAYQELPESSAYLTRTAFGEFLERTEFTEIPQMAMIQMFEKVGEELVRRNFCLKRQTGSHGNRNYSDILIRLIVDHDTGEENKTKHITLRPSRMSEPSTNHGRREEIAYRFPCFQPLCQMLKQAAEQNFLPDNVAFEQFLDKEFSAIDNVKRLLGAEISMQFERMFKTFANLESEKAKDAAEVDKDRDTLHVQFSVFVWLVEEFALLERLLTVSALHAEKSLNTIPLDRTIATLHLSEFTSFKSDKLADLQALDRLFDCLGIECGEASADLASFEVVLAMKVGVSA